MNERLRQEIRDYIGAQKSDVFRDVAEHFYNLALEDTRVVVYKLIDEYLEVHDTGYGMVNVNTVLEDLINVRDFIDNLTE